MRVFRSKKKLSAAIIGVAVIGTFAAVAFASTPFNFMPDTPLVTANFDNKVQQNSDRVKFQTKIRPTSVSRRSSSVRAATAAGITIQAS